MTAALVALRIAVTVALSVLEQLARGVGRVGEALRRDDFCDVHDVFEAEETT